MSDYIYHTIKPHPIAGEANPEAKTLATMRQMSEKWPDCKWAAYQCVDLSSPRIGNVNFIAVGPGRTIPCVTVPQGMHWSYMFIGFVNLESGVIEQPEPIAVHV